MNEEYEYAVQWRWNGEKEWGLLRLTNPSEEAARRRLEMLKVKYPKDKLRIVRRPVNDWEVVK